MSVRAIVVGHNQFEKYTAPFVNQLKQYMPDLLITVVDNGSDPPYPEIDGVNMIRGDGKSYAAGINLGINQSERADRYIILNNDVILKSAFSLKGLDNGTLYGAEMCDWYAVGWCLVLSRYMWEAVGEFDEGYTTVFYDDLDYSYRVLLKGMRVEKLPLPFEHIQFGTSGFYDGERLRTENRERFEKKFGTTKEKIYDIYRR